MDGSSTNDTAEKPESKMTLTEYRNERENVRKTFFKSKTKQTKNSGSSTSKQTKKPEKTVIINIARRDDFGDLKPVRGKRLPIQLKDTASALEVKSEAIDKHADHDQEFCASESYVLLYPDFKEVCFVPGTSEMFKINLYKESLGKPYSQVVIYLCNTSGFEYTGKNDDQSIDSEDLHNNNGGDEHKPFLNVEMPEPYLQFDNLNERDSDIPNLPPIFNFEESEVHNNTVENEQNNYHQLQDQCTPEKYQDKIKKLQSTYRNTESFQLSIRRRKIWIDASQKLKRAFKNGVKTLSVHFIALEKMLPMLVDH